jgi:hypothetical protein
MPTPTAVEIALSDEERLVLEAWTRRRTTAQALALRARILRRRRTARGGRDRKEPCPRRNRRRDCRPLAGQGRRLRPNRPHPRAPPDQTLRAARAPHGS